MPNKQQVLANEIIGRPLDAEFWKHTAAQTIVDEHSRLLGHGIQYEAASDIILAIWNAAREEYGE